MELDNKIETLLKDFYNISGIRVSIHDTTFKEIYCYPNELEPFCKYIQKIPEIKAQCLKSDSDAFSVVKSTDKPYVYRCKCGLYEAVAPIYNYGRLTGYLMLGQVIDNNRTILNNALTEIESHNIDKNILLNLSNEIIRLDLEKLYSYIHILTILAEHFTRTNKIKNNYETLPFLTYQEIVNHPKKALNLSHLAKKFGCSISTLTTVFKKEYGISVHQFIIETRLKEAADLLTHSNKAIKEISEDCGFYDQNHFYRSFKKTYKVSPTEFRKRARFS